MENIIDVTRLWKFPIDVPLGRASGGDEHLDAQKSAQPSKVDHKSSLTL